MERVGWAFVASAAVGLSALLAGCVPFTTACPAIGFVYDDPLSVRVGFAAPPDAVVDGCLGSECDPVDLISEGTDWVLPVKEPFSPGGGVLSPGDFVRIVVRDADGVVLRDVSVEAPFAPGPDGPCPAPGTFEPVVVS